MNRSEIIARLDYLEAEQREAEIGMLAAVINSGRTETIHAALDEAVAANGLKVPVEMHLWHLAILGTVMELAENRVRPTADLVLRDLGSDRDPGLDRRVECIYWMIGHGFRVGPDDAVRYGQRIAAAGMERLHLGQRVWPEALYRWFDWDERLLYVGITRSLATRQESHSQKSSWSRFAARCTVERAPDRASVELMEYHAIKGEKPLFNHMHNDTPEARERLVRYLAEQGHFDLLAPTVSRG